MPAGLAPGQPAAALPCLSIGVVGFPGKEQGVPVRELLFKLCSHTLILKHAAGGCRAPCC